MVAAKPAFKLGRLAEEAKRADTRRVAIKYAYRGGGGKGGEGKGADN